MAEDETIPPSAPSAPSAASAASARMESDHAHEVRRRDDVGLHSRDADETVDDGEAFEDVGWAWERDLESQGHGECWRSSHLEVAVEGLEELVRADGDARPTGDARPHVTRSDIRIYEDVCALLFEHPSVDAAKVEVEVVGGVVILRGDVCTRQEIVLCAALVREIDGIDRSEILLRIRPDEPIRWDEIGDDIDGYAR